MYEARLAQHCAEIARLTRRERAISVARLIAFLLIVVVALVHWSWLVLLPAAAFLALVIAHEPLVAARRRAAAAAAFCERGRLRMRGEWAGKGDGGSDLFDEHHPFASDLDLYGPGSLFELISIAATRAGRSTLAAWLQHPERVTPEEVRARQQAVAELRQNVALREELAVVAGEVKGEIEGAHLEEWSAGAPLLAARGEWLGTLTVGVVSGATFLLAAWTFLTGLVAATNPGAVAPLPASWMLPFFGMLIVRSVVARRLHPRVVVVIGAVERRESALALLARLLGRLERERFETPRLVALRARLERDGTPASRQIERLRALVALLDARRNQMFAPFASMLLWSELVAFSIERWRRESGSEIVAWMTAVGELEALLSLASFAFEHPDFATPEIVDGDAHFDAVAAAHPLIPAGRRVANDVRLGGPLRLLLVSGSNMSGKSTLLRTVGTNAVLALAGTNVCAASLRVTPMAIGASIRIHDSLAEGASRFYAEIVRIREILAMPAPLLFLLDELLHGTNSHDRRIGGEAIVRGLLERGAIGLATTHDLALAHIADALAPRAANVHFEDHLEAGAVAFDYVMRPGVVTRSNALALMRAVGIEV